MARLKGKAAVIISAASRDNMAQVMTRRFRAEGAQVMVAGRNEDALKELADEISGYHALCDITRRDEVFALAQSAKSAMGEVNVAINATGWGLLKPFLENTEEDLDRMMDLQFKGPFFFFQAMIEAMDKGGSLIQISSATAKIMLNNHAAYMGTKAGTDHVVRCVAHEFGERGIRANSISPGLTDTPMVAEAKKVPGLLDSFIPSYPLGRYGTSEDIASAAVFIASDECFMTGENFQVNGGLCLRGNPTAQEIEAATAEAMRGE